MILIRKVLRKDNTRVPSLLIFDENRNSMISKVLVSVVYCIMDNYLFVDYLCLQQCKLYLEHKGFDIYLENHAISVFIKYQK